MMDNYKGFNIVPVIGEPGKLKIPGIRFGIESPVATDYAEAQKLIDRYIEINPFPMSEVF